MAYPSHRVPLSRRLLAGVLSFLCACEAGLLPAAAAMKSNSRSRRAGRAPPPSTSCARPSPAPAGHRPPRSRAARCRRLASVARAPFRSGRDVAARSLLTNPGVTAGVLRSAGPALIAAALAARRVQVSAWVAQELNAPLDGIADGAAAPEDALARLRANLPDLLRAETPVLPASASPLLVRAAQDEALRRIARLGLPDFTPRVFVPSADFTPAAAAPPPAPPAAAAPVPSDADLRERLGQKQELSGEPDADGLADLDKIAGRVDGELGPRTGTEATDADAAHDANWASLEALRRLFDAAGASPDKPAPSGPPVPSDQAKAIDARVSRIEALKAELPGDIAQRDAANAMLTVAARARDAALADRRSGKDDMEFRQNFSRLSMVMDLSYSLNLLNSADAALTSMQNLLAQKVTSINQQQAANTAAGTAAGAQAGNTAQWTQQAQQSAAADVTQAASFAALGADVGGVAASVTRFGSDVPALLAMIDARDKGQSANAIAEYNRRLALLPSIEQQLKSGSSSASSGVTSLSLAYLQSQAAEVAGDIQLLAGADAKIASVPVEFAGALIVAVPGVPSESVTNPTPAQMLALLGRRQTFWQSQYNQESSLLTSIQQAMDPSNTATALDAFGSPQPVSLVVWQNQENALDSQLAGAEAPMLAQADADEAVIESRRRRHGAAAVVQSDSGEPAHEPSPAFDSARNPRHPGHRRRLRGEGRVHRPRAPRLLHRRRDRPAPSGRGHVRGAEPADHRAPAAGAHLDSAGGDGLADRAQRRRGRRRLRQRGRAARPEPGADRPQEGAGGQRDLPRFAQPAESAQQRPDPVFEHGDRPIRPDQQRRRLSDAVHPEDRAVPAAFRRLQPDFAVGAGVRRRPLRQRERGGRQHREPAQDLRHEPGDRRRRSAAGDAGSRSERHA